MDNQNTSKEHRNWVDRSNRLLEVEARLIRSLDLRNCTLLHDLLGSDAWLTSFAALGFLPISPLAHGLFDITEDGREAVTIPAYAGPEPNFESCTEFPSAIIDFIAFFADRPWRWWQYTGVATFLAEHRIGTALMCGTPLSVFATPLGWLRAQGKGVCALTKDFERLRYTSLLKVDSTCLRGAILWHLKRPAVLPRIEVVP
jgi:hypothetical protein